MSRAAAARPNETDPPTRRNEAVGASGLNDSHRRVLEATFAHVDRLLGEIERVSSTTAPFAGVFPDLSALQAKVVQDAVVNLRAQLIAANSALVQRLPVPATRATWSIRTQLTMADIALEEISPIRLRGYGALDGQSLARVQQVVSDLTRSLQRVQTYLAQGLGRDLAARLERLEKVPVNLDLLRTLERLIVGRGLLEFRGTLQSLLEQLESGTFEIAFFGRVSSGKSSLLNQLLGVDVLPVGVTPVTSVPTRIQWGLEPQAVISFAEGPEQRIAVSRLGEFVAEAGNPGNARHVVRAQVSLPSDLLRGGLVLVDTPGVGSIAHSGARETYSYLPRCDLGVVLVDAGSSANDEDLEVVRLLYESAIPATVLVSKSDLVSAEDLERLRTYLAGEVARTLQLEVRVHAVSTAPAALGLTSSWMASHLFPAVAQAHAMGEASARRKLAHLRDAVASTLMTLKSSVEGAPTDAAHADRVEQLALQVEATLLAERAGVSSLVMDLAQQVPAAFAEAAHHWAWGESASGLLEEAEADLVRLAGNAVNQTQELLRRTCISLTKARDGVMREAEGDEWAGAELTLDFLLCPAVPSARLKSAGPLPRRWPRFPRLSERRARQALSALTRAAATILASFGEDLRQWALEQFERLAVQVAADTEPVRARLRRLPKRQGQSVDKEGIEADLAQLRCATETVAATVIKYE